MASFVVVAACMAAIAAAIVAVPLLRIRRHRIAGAVAALCIAGGAAVLYPLWSNWDWRTPGGGPAAGPDVLAMVGKLEKHLRDAPDDKSGWVMLGRSYVALERFDDAVIAYDHAKRLDAQDPDALLGLGEAMSLQAGGSIPAAAADDFEQALRLAPDNPKALLYGGFVAAGRGDAGAAVQRWRALKELHPPPQIEELLDARIAELSPPGGAPGAGGVGNGAAGAGGGAGGGVGAAAAAVAQGPGTPDARGAAGAAPSAPTAQATVNLSITPALKSRVGTADALFVFAREPGSQGPPLAVKRLTAAAIGSRVVLSADDSMVAGRALAAGSRVAITARVSFGGGPLPATGDLYGELTYDVGRDGVRDLVIDRVAQ